MDVQLFLPSMYVCVFFDCFLLNQLRVLNIMISLANKDVKQLLRFYIFFPPH